MRKLTKEDKYILGLVHKHAQVCGKQVYVVGGFIRDLLLGRKKDNPDIDFAVRKGSIPFGRSLNAFLQAGFVVLDSQRGCCRLVKKTSGGIYTLDFSDFRAGSIEEDLLKRDFTVNAMAVEIGVLLKAGYVKSIIDVCGSLKDLRAGRLRLASSASYDDDPLRIMRAFSLQAVLVLKPVGGVLRQAADKCAKLSGVSPERVRDELFKIFETGNAYQFVRLMDAGGVLRMAIPEIEVMRGVKQGPYHHLDVWKHSLESLRQFELLCSELSRNKKITSYLRQEVSSGRSRLALLKLGTLLHDIGKPAAKKRLGARTVFHGHELLGARISSAVARRMKLSNSESDALRKMVFCHLRPGYLADNAVVTARSKFRYFRDTGSEAAGILMLSMADQRSTRGPLTSKQSRVQHERICLGLLKEHFKEAENKVLPRLVNGNDLMKEFKLVPSPLIGSLLSGLEELRAIGKIKTRSQALSAAAKLLAEYRAKVARKNKRCSSKAKAADAY